VTAVPAAPQPPPAPGIEVTHDPEVAVRFVQLWLCDPCLDGMGGECHTPGCALWLNRAPDIQLRDSPAVTIMDAAPEAAPEVWSDAVPPGGMVCAVPDDLTADGICGNPVESEPCNRHDGEPAAPARSLTAPDVVAGLLADVAESRAQLTDAAPELAAAMAETRTVRDGYQELCREFSPSAQSGMSARVSLTVLNRHRVKARLPLLATTVIAATREDITLRYRRERDEAREQAEQMELERNEARQLLANHKRAAARVHEELSAQLAEVRRIACQCGKDAVFVWRELLAYLEGING
jgi:hypothetical protein